MHKAEKVFRKCTQRKVMTENFKDCEKYCSMNYNDNIDNLPLL